LHTPLDQLVSALGFAKQLHIPLVVLAAALDHEDAVSVAREFEREGDACCACSDDAYVNL
jgi:hypothetical protein